MGRWSTEWADGQMLVGGGFDLADDLLDAAAPVGPAPKLETPRVEARAVRFDGCDVVLPRVTARVHVIRIGNLIHLLETVIDIRILYHFEP